VTVYRSKHVLVERHPGKRVHLVIRFAGGRKLDLEFISPLKVSATVAVEEEMKTEGNHEDSQRPS
jgi:hypothetical protein